MSVSLFDTMVDWLGYFPHVWWHKREEPTRTGMRHPHFALYGSYRAGDGRPVGFAILSDAHWTALARDVLDRPDLLADPDLATNEGRVEPRSARAGPRGRAFGSRRLRVARAARGRGHSVRRRNTVGDVMEHPQLAQPPHGRGRLACGPHSHGGVPFLLDGRPDRAGLGSGSASTPTTCCGDRVTRRG